MLKSVIGMYQFLSQPSISQEGINCLADFEKRLLLTSRNFFRALQQSLLGNLPLSDFLAKADKQLLEEMGRLGKYLTWPDIDKQIISEFQREVLMNNQAELFETAQGTLNFEQPRGLLSLFVLSKEADLKLLFKLYRPIKDGLKPIADLYKAFLVRQGQSYVESCETTQDGKQLAVKDLVANSGLIEKFIDLLQRQNKIIKDCFQQDTTFVRQLQLAF